MTTNNDLLDKCNSIDLTLVSLQAYFENQAAAYAAVYGEETAPSPLLDIIKESREDIKSVTQQFVATSGIE